MENRMFFVSSLTFIELSRSHERAQCRVYRVHVSRDTTADIASQAKALLVGLMTI